MEILRVYKVAAINCSDGKIEMESRFDATIPHTGGSKNANERRIRESRGILTE